LVHISHDDGATWENITPPDLPEWALVSIIEPSPHEAGTAYLAATRYKLDDYRPYIFRTNDYGKTWQAIVGDIPAHEFTRVIRVDPERPGLLYAGTETGAYVSFDDGAHWSRMGGNLPVAPIYDLVRKDGDLVAATHGRSFWILEDVAILHQLAAGEKVEEHPRLFAPASAPRYPTGSWPGGETPGIDYGHTGPLVFGLRRKQLPSGRVEARPLDAGENPPDGVAVRYWLPNKPEGDITLTFLDEQGETIRSFNSKKEKPAPASDEETSAEDTALQLGQEGGEGPAAGTPNEEEKAEEQPTIAKEAGMNRFIWDMRAAPAHKIEGDAGMAFFLIGPMVLPGRYQARLTVGDQSWTQPFEITPDPRGHETAETRQAQYDLLVRINRELSEANDAVNRIRDLTGQISAWSTRVKGQERLTEVVKAADALKKALTTIEEAIFKTEPDTDLFYTATMKLSGRLAALKFAVDFSNYAPTRQAVEVYEELAGKIDARLARLDEVLKTELAQLNQQIRETELPTIAPRPLKEDAISAGETTKTAG
jgi:DNA-binding FrmR family transcriptional regulator